MTTLPTTPPMLPKVSLRRLLARLTAIALSTYAVGAASADEATRPSAQEPPEVELTADLPIDPELIDPADAAAALGRSLAIAVARMRPLEATHLMTTWAMSADPVRRLAVAHSLEWQFKLVGDSIVIDHLARDPDPAIRKEIARAAWVRRGAADVYGALAHLLEDPDPEVRAIALRAG